MHEQCLCDGVGKIADLFQSYHQEGGTLLVLSVVLPCLEGQLRLLIVSALLRCVRKGSHQDKFSGVSEWTKAMYFGQRYRNFRWHASLRPPKDYYCSWWPLFTDFSSEDVVIRLKLYEIGCMMRILTPNVHGEVHISHLDNMQRRTDGPKKHAEWTRQNWHEVLITDECRMCLQPGNRQRRVWRQSGQAERLRHTLSSLWSKVVVPWCFGVTLCGTDVRHWWSWKKLEIAIRYRNGILRPIVQPYRLNFVDEFVLTDGNSHRHRAHLVNEFLHDNNVAKLEWPTCSPDMNPIEHARDTLKRAVFGRDDPPTTLRNLYRIAIEEWDSVDQQDLD